MAGESYREKSAARAFAKEHFELDVDTRMLWRDMPIILLMPLLYGM